MVAGAACKAIPDLFRAEKEGTFDSPGLPPGRGGDVDCCVHDTDTSPPPPPPPPTPRRGVERQGRGAGRESVRKAVMFVPEMGGCGTR